MIAVFKMASFHSVAFAQSSTHLLNPYSTSAYITLPATKISRSICPAKRVKRPSYKMSARPAPTVTIGDVPTSLHNALATALADAPDVNPTLALSGGSLPKILQTALKDTDVDVAAWRVTLADERIVPPHDADSNRRDIVERFPSMNVVPIDHTLSPAECAADYERKLVNLMGEAPKFDAVLLGLGPDGHTCSLFPHHPLLNVSDRRVAAITDSPKPPPNRVTLTLPVLNAASHVIFVCTGASKAPVVKDILENAQSKLPGALVRPQNGTVTWILDQAAASELSVDKMHLSQQT